jgi:hypothetical protein
MTHRWHRLQTRFDMVAFPEKIVHPILPRASREYPVADAVCKGSDFAQFTHT